MAVMLNQTRTLRKPYLSVTTAFLHVLGHSLGCRHDLLGRLTRRFPCNVHEIRSMAAWRHGGMAATAVVVAVVAVIVALVLAARTL